MKIDKNPYVEIELQVKEIKLIITSLEEYKKSVTVKKEIKAIENIIDVLKSESDVASRSQPGYYLDKSIPLQTRWKAFSNTSNEYDYIPTIKTSFSKHLVNEFWPDVAGEFRNKTFSIFEEVDTLNYQLLEGEECDWTREQVDEMMEAVMKFGYTDFIWDW